MPVEKRAYTDTEKQAREQKITEAAQELLAEKGFHAINMAEVAQAAGLAKGTVYRYFNTKEELFLSVFEEHLRIWYGDFKSAIEEQENQIAVESFVELLVNSVADKPQFTRLIALKHIILEHNISFERAHESIIWMQESLAELGQLIASKLNLSPEQGVQILTWTFIFIIGLEGMAHPAPSSRQVYDTEANLQKPDFSAELRSFLLTTISSFQSAQ